MKKLFALTVTVVTSLAGMVPAAHAASTAPAPFDVTVTLTTVCQVGTIAPVLFAYTAFQGSPQSSTGGGFNLTCTKGLTPTAMTFDTVTQSVAGLTYTLTALTPVLSTGAAQPYTIQGTMAAGQAGDAGATATQARTLTVSY